MYGTASGMIFAKSKILRSSRGCSTHGAAHFLRFLRSRRQSRPEDLCRRIQVVSPSGSFTRGVTPWTEFIWVPFPTLV